MYHNIIGKCYVYWVFIDGNILVTNVTNETLCSINYLTITSDIIGLVG